jgi:hypothetical protein
VDFNGDGNNDIISGSWPGDIYLFTGKGKGEFAQGKVLIEAKKFGKGKMEGYTILQASSVSAVDWDSDGNLDIIAGEIFGNVYLLENTGTAKKPDFQSAVMLKYGDEGKKVTVISRAGPCIADWDLDGKVDVVVGSESGGVSFFRNIGTKKEPKLAEPVVLVPKDDKIGYRMKPFVTDWDNDDLPDLLVGGCVSEEKTLHGYVWLFLRQKD